MCSVDKRNPRLWPECVHRKAAADQLKARWWHGRRLSDRVTRGGPRTKAHVHEDSPGVRVRECVTAKFHYRVNRGYLIYKTPPFLVALCRKGPSRNENAHVPTGLQTLKGTYQESQGGTSSNLARKNGAAEPSSSPARKRRVEDCGMNSRTPWPHQGRRGDRLRIGEVAPTDPPAGMPATKRVHSGSIYIRP